jgi:hypothetical protein
MKQADIHGYHDERYSQQAKGHNNGGDGVQPRFDVERLLRKRRYTAVFMMTWFWAAQSAPERYLDAVRVFSPDSHVFVMTDDAQGVRERMMQQAFGYFPHLKESFSWLFDTQHIAELQVRERAIYALVDGVLTLTDRDAELVGSPSLMIPVMLQKPIVPSLPTNLRWTLVSLSLLWHTQFCYRTLPHFSFLSSFLTLPFVTFPGEGRGRVHAGGHAALGNEPHTHTHTHSLFLPSFVSVLSYVTR